MGVAGSIQEQAKKAQEVNWLPSPPRETGGEASERPYELSFVNLSSPSPSGSVGPVITSHMTPAYIEDYKKSVTLPTKKTPEEFGEFFASPTRAGKVKTPDEFADFFAPKSPRKGSPSRRMSEKKLSVRSTRINTKSAKLESRASKASSSSEMNVLDKRSSVVSQKSEEEWKDISDEFDDVEITGTLLGKGSFGNVYIGVKDGDEYIAVKVMEKQPFLTRKVIQQETIVMGLDHPNIIKLYKLVERPDSYVLYMEYVKKPFYDLIVNKPKGHLTVRECHKYFRQLTEGIDYLHRHGIAHRDIKPENCLFDPSNDRIVIIDFGFAIKWDPSGAPSMDVEARGSPAYASPEIFMGQPRPSTSPDIWALGVTLYAMASGDLPFADLERAKLVQKIVYGPPNLNNPLFSEYFKRLITGMLQKEWGRRYTISDIMKSDWYREDL